MNRLVALRLLAILLSVVSLGWLVLLVFYDYFPEPETPSIIIIYALMVLLPPISFLLLIGLLRWIVRVVDPPAELRKRIRHAVWVAGPLGCAWAIFRLTDQGRESPASS